MIRRQCLSSIVLLLAVVMAACGGSGDSATTTSAVGVGASTSSTSTTEPVPSSTTSLEPTTTTALSVPFVDWCVGWNPTAAILSEHGEEDPAFEQLGVFFTETVDGTLVNHIEFGQLYHPDEGEWDRYSTVTDDRLGQIHSMLHFNQARVLLQTASIMQRMETITVLDSPDQDAGELASITTDAVVYREQDVTEQFEELTGNDGPDELTLQQPEPMSETERMGLWEVIAAQEATYAPAALGNFQSALILRDIDLIEVRSNLCTLMGTELILMVETIESGSAVFADLFPYLALQELLLANEYLQASSDLLSDPGVDWLEATDVDLATEFDGVTTVGEYLGLLQSGAMGAIFEYRALTQDL